MTQFRRCMIFLVNAAAALLSVSEAGDTLKHACPGDAVRAFQNIEFDRCNAFISLHVNGKRNTEIATWLFQNCTLKETRLDQYKNRLFLDQNGTITIYNIHHFDQGKYVVMPKNNTLPSIQEVEIMVMESPKQDCKPIIKRLGYKLFASVESVDCGNPIVSPYWKGYGGVPDINDPMIKITPGTESQTYYACIQGPALQCAKDKLPLGNCSPFIIEGDTSRTMSSESCSTAGFIVVIVVLGILLIMAIVAIVILILILKRRRRKNANEEHTVGLLDETRRGEKPLEHVNEEHTVGLLDATLPGGKHLDDVNAEHANIPPIFAKDCENRRSPSNDQQHRLETDSDMDFEMNEVGTDEQSGIDRDKIRQIQELRKAAICKICFENKVQVLFMPCNHVATCDECSIPLPNCPVCRATIKERKRICFDSNE